jgi:hypothetical protein
MKEISATDLKQRLDRSEDIQIIKREGAERVRGSLFRKLEGARIHGSWHRLQKNLRDKLRGKACNEKARC